MDRCVRRRGTPASLSISTSDCTSRQLFVYLLCFDSALHCQEGSYHVDNASSRPLTEAKQRRARLVLRWVTTLEARVPFFFHFSPHHRTPFSYTPPLLFLTVHSLRVIILAKPSLRQGAYYRALVVRVTGRSNPSIWLNEKEKRCGGGQPFAI